MNTPALDTLLSTDYVSYGPGGYSCDGCPFALTGPMDKDLHYPFDRDWHGGWNGNTDASEAWYKCGLPGSTTSKKFSVWGEYPGCTEAEWKAVARLEVDGLAR